MKCGHKRQEAVNVKAVVGRLDTGVAVCADGSMYEPEKKLAVIDGIKILVNVIWHNVKEKE